MQGFRFYVGIPACYWYILSSIKPNDDPPIKLPTVSLQHVTAKTKKTNFTCFSEQEHVKLDCHYVDMCTNNAIITNNQIKELQ